MNKSAKAAKSLIEFFGNVEDVIDALNKLAKMEQFEQESREKLERLKNDVELGERKIAEFHAGAVAANDRRVNIEAEIEKILADAKAAAQDDSIAMHRATNKECEKILEDAKQQRAKLLAEVDKIRFERNDLTKALNVERAELQAVRSEMAKLKERIGA